MSTPSKILLIVTLFILFFHDIMSNNNNLIYTGKTKTLVVIDDWNYLNTHSFFWDQLRGKND